MNTISNQNDKQFSINNPTSSSPNRYTSSGSTLTNRFNTMNNISMSTSSPLIAKYMNQNNLNNSLTTIENKSINSENGENGRTQKNNDSNISTNIISVSNTNTPSTCTVTKLTTLNTILNPDGYLSAKLNQTRAAREAFLRGNTTSSNSLSSNSTVLSVSNSSSITNDNSMLNKNNHNNSNSDQNLIKNKFFPKSDLNIDEQINRDDVNVKNNEFKNNTPVNHENIQNKDFANLCKTKSLDGYVGFVNLPNQVYRKAVKKGFEFNLMVVGQSCLGKSTFINSLFLTELYNANEFPGAFQRKRKTIYVDSTTVLLSEKGVNLRLTVVDTPGFGENIDNTNCWGPIVDYIDLKYEEYLNSESRVSRKPVVDDRIHCCLYFIAPDHSLNQLDIEVMKKLHDRVNLIPLIAKADTMTQDEILKFKNTILNEINENKIQIYEFPDLDDEDMEMSKKNSSLKSKIPFAIVGSNSIIEVDGKPVRARKYPWGHVNIDDLSHCDFMALRTMLIRTHMQDLKDVTNNVHYENYRYKKLSMVAGDKTKLPNNKNPFQHLEEERKEAELRLAKMKTEMEAVFELKVKEKVLRLKESESSLEKQQETAKNSIEKEEKELEQHRLLFIKERQLWEELNREEEEKLRQTLDKEADKKKKKIF